MASVTREALVAAVVVVVMVVAIGGAEGQGSSCSTEMSNLNVCVPFVLPENNTVPSAGCCAALEAVNHDCLCNTLNIASRLPSQCNLPSFSCSSA